MAGQETAGDLGPALCCSRLLLCALFFVSAGTWRAEFNQGTWPVSLSLKNLALTALWTRIYPAPGFAPLALVKLFSLAHCRMRLLATR